MKTLNKHAPKKTKYVRGNHAPFMNREILRAIMKRTRLRNKFIKAKTAENKFAYNKQRNYCVSLLRKSKKSYFENLDEKKITDSKTFWKTVKPYLSDKTISGDKITLIENEDLLSDNQTIAETLNRFLF